MYRPFDNRWFYNDIPLLNRPGPELQAAWGSDNVCLYAMPGGTGAGPAVWCHGLLPDYHAFRGSYGGYAFPLWDRRRGAQAHNLNPELLLGLNAAYGVDVEPRQVFDAILCLMSATSYTLRFAEDLEDVFPHVPFPASHETFLEAAALGAHIRAVETFARVPGAAFLPAHVCHIDTEPRGNLAEVNYGDGCITLCADGSGRVSGIPLEIWEFSVSGYRVLPRWLTGRVGREVDYVLVRDLRDICGRIADLLALFGQADILLESTLQETLTREALNVDA